MTDERSASDCNVESSESGARADASEGFGARLAAAREQRALTPADVARALNLRAAVIVAIEEEDFAALPRMAFVRGYARTYARLLDVSEAEIAQGLTSWRDPGEDGRLPRSPASVSTKRGFGRSLHGHAGLILTLLSLLVAVLLAAVLMMIWPEGGFTAARSEPAAEAPAPAPVMRASPAPVSFAAPSAEPRLQADGVDMGPDFDGSVVWEARDELFADDGYDGVEAAEETAQMLRQTVGQAAAMPESASESGHADGFSVRREIAEGGQLLRVFAQGEDLVRLRFSGDCWVEIRDAEGRGVVSDLAREGQTLEVQGQGPFRLLLGYAHVVQLAYNGEEVALAPHIRNDIASLVVGR